MIANPPSILFFIRPPWFGLDAHRYKVRAHLFTLKETSRSILAAVNFELLRLPPSPKYNVIMSNDDLIADFLARGGTITKLPMKGVRRSTLKPEIHKKRDMLAGLGARAAGVRV